MVVFRLGLLTLSNGVVSVCVSVCMQWAFFFESIYSHVYGVKWSLWGVPIGSFLNFSKILIFGHFLAVFGSKLTPKLTFSLNIRAFFLVGSRTDLRLKMGLLGVLLEVCRVLCRNSHF